MSGNRLKQSLQLIFVWILLLSGGAIPANAQETKRLSYEDARWENLNAATATHIYGVELSTPKGEQDYVVFLYSGFVDRGVNVEQCTRRIWRLARQEVIAFKTVSGFSCSGRPVQEFVVQRDAKPIEELFVEVPLPTEGVAKRTRMQSLAAIGLGFVAPRPCKDCELLFLACRAADLPAAECVAELFECRIASCRRPFGFQLGVLQ